MWKSWKHWEKRGENLLNPTTFTRVSHSQLFFSSFFFHVFVEHLELLINHLVSVPGNRGFIVLNARDVSLPRLYLMIPFIASPVFLYFSFSWFPDGRFQNYFVFHLDVFSGRCYIGGYQSLLDLGQWNSAGNFHTLWSVWSNTFSPVYSCIRLSLFQQLLFFKLDEMHGSECNRRRYEFERGEKAGQSWQWSRWHFVLGSTRVQLGSIQVDPQRPQHRRQGKQERLHITDEHLFGPAFDLLRCQHPHWRAVGWSVGNPTHR